MQKSTGVTIFLFGVMLGTLFSGVSLIAFVNAGMETKIIKHGCGEYNSTTGVFQWVKGK